MLTLVVWIYVLAVPLWIGIWWSATGFRLMRHNPLLGCPSS